MNLKERAEEIRYERDEGENTAERVGGVLCDIVDGLAGKADTSVLNDYAMKSDVPSDVSDLTDNTGLLGGGGGGTSPDLTPYLTKEEASSTYQPKGNYQPSGDYITSSDAQSTLEGLVEGLDLKGPKGDKGDAFTYEDFTPEQLESLRGPQGIQGIQGIPGVDGNDGQPGRDADVWTIGDDGYWYRNGIKTKWKAEGKDGQGVAITGVVDHYSDLESSGYVTPSGGERILATAGSMYLCMESGSDYYKHLFLWTGTEWFDLGEVAKGADGEDGTSSYIHIAYAHSVTFDDNGNAISATGFTVDKETGVTYEWIGMCVTNTIDDPGSDRISDYKWNYVKGMDGNGYSHVYYRTKQFIAPVIVQTSSDSNGRQVTQMEYLPAVSNASAIGGEHKSVSHPSGFSEVIDECTDDPKGVEETWPYEWEAVRHVSGNIWPAYPSPMKLHSHYGKDGKDGKDGTDGKDGQDGRDGVSPDGHYLKCTPDVVNYRANPVGDYSLSSRVITCVVMGLDDHDNYGKLQSYSGYYLNCRAHYDDGHSDAWKVSDAISQGSKTYTSTLANASDDSDADREVSIEFALSTDNSTSASFESNIVFTKFVPIVIDGHKGADGRDGVDGTDGHDGAAGKMFYSMGEWSDLVEYKIDDLHIPMVHYGDAWNENTESYGKYYYLKVSPAQGTSQSPENSNIWAEADDFGVVITQGLFAPFAKIGQAIISGDIMFSQYGKYYTAADTFVDITQQTQKFDNKPPYIAFANSDGSKKGDNQYPRFEPNWYVDLRSGKMVAARGNFVASSNGDVVMRNARINDVVMHNARINGSLLSHRLFERTFSEVTSTSEASYVSFDTVTNNNASFDGDVLLINGAVPDAAEYMVYLPPAELYEGVELTVINNGSKISSNGTMPVSIPLMFAVNPFYDASYPVVTSAGVAVNRFFKPNFFNYDFSYDYVASTNPETSGVASYTYHAPDGVAQRTYLTVNARVVRFVAMKCPGIDTDQIAWCLVDAQFARPLPSSSGN